MAILDTVGGIAGYWWFMDGNTGCSRRDSRIMVGYGLLLLGAVGMAVRYHWFRGRFPGCSRKDSKIPQVQG